MTTTDYGSEISSYDSDRLDEAASRLYKGSASWYNRYAFYRRHGHSPADSLAYTFIWIRNTIEQYERRLSHETGAEGWRSMSVLDQEYWSTVW